VAYTAALRPYTDAYFNPVNFAGAFGDALWLDGWTFLSQAGYVEAPGSQTVTITDASLAAGQSYTWTRDNIYLLDGLVYVEEGATLTIEPGTLIQGKQTPTSGDNTSALIITRGAKIFANGTPTQPIIFTAEGDDPTDFTDLPLDATGRWGGLVLLGRASTNRAGNTGQIEGISSTETRAVYGGDAGAIDDHDNSGVLRYVSIRHGGVGLSANNEINGLTLGAVGDGTTIEFIEVLRNSDDGYEWFGGTVNTRYLVSAFNDDDGFDWDEGFRGKHQFWFVLQAATGGADSGAEQDGGTTPEDGTPFATPMIYNATYIGRGASTGTSNRALRFRDNSGGFYYNSIFTDFGGGCVSVEDLSSGADSQGRLDAGELGLANNVFFGFGRGNSFATCVQTEASGLPDNTGALSAYLSAQANVFADPALGGISRSEDGGLDPRPAAGGVAYTAALRPYTDAYFNPVNFAGAFGKYNWISDWTFLSAAGYLNGQNSITDVEQTSEVPTTITLAQNYPNPFNPATTIEFTLDRTQRIRLAVYDLLGREVAVLADGVETAGSYRATFDASNLASGLYLYQLRTESGSILTRTMTLVK
jgi:hypothetical protein